MTKPLQSKPVQVLLGTLIAAHMAVVKRTTRWEVRGFERVEDIVGNGEGVIALTWHSRFLMLNSAWSRGWQMPHVMISRSRDGDIVHYTSRALGLRTIRGSTRKLDKQKGGRTAGAETVRALDAGGCIVVTPDGPRGPRQRLQPGALRLARLSGAPLIPCAFAVSRRKTIGSWDQTVLPGWFGRGVILWGEPVVIARDTPDAELERVRVELEARMNADLATADAATGHTPSEPAKSRK